MTKRIIAGIIGFVLLMGCFSAYGEKKFKKVCEINTRQNTIRYTYVDESGKPTEGPDGYVSVELIYEGRRNWPEKVRYLDAEGERCANKDGYAVVKYAYSTKRKAVRIALYDVKGDLYEVEDSGWCRINIKYDQNTEVSGAIYSDRKKRQVDVEDEMEPLIGKLITEDGNMTVPGFTEEELMERPGNRRKASETSV